jgi:hypothetical protein
MVWGVAAFGLIVLGVAGAVGSLTAFSVGIAKKRREVWLTATMTAILSVGLSAGGVFWIGSLAVYQMSGMMARIPAATLPPPRVRPVADAHDADMRKRFRAATGLELPAEAMYLAGEDCSGERRVVYFMIAVPPSFKAELDARLTATKKRPALLTVPDSVAPLKDLPTWNDEVAAQGLVYYEWTTGDANRGGLRTALALHEGAGLLWCVIEEYGAPPVRDGRSPPGP